MLSWLSITSWAPSQMMAIVVTLLMNEAIWLSVLPSVVARKLAWTYPASCSSHLRCIVGVSALVLGGLMLVIASTWKDLFPPPTVLFLLVRLRIMVRANKHWPASFALSH